MPTPPTSSADRGFRRSNSTYRNSLIVATTLNLPRLQETDLFTRAIVRPPGPHFADGLTTALLGRPDIRKAVIQHEQYCRALEKSGLMLTRLDPDDRYPDSTFVEDTAVLLPGTAILANPGAPERRGEVESIEGRLAGFFTSFHRILTPGTLDAGDVCEAGDDVFIGISGRTNRSGADQLAKLLGKMGYNPLLVDIRNAPGILHLKSGLSYVGEKRLAVIDSLSGHRAISGYDLLRVPGDEAYAANCVRVNDSLLVATGYPKTEKLLRELGFNLILLEVSEFQKMDGGLSCLSLRF